MRSVTQKQLAAGDVGVSGDPFASCFRVYTLSTLRRFDIKHRPMVKYGPLIPWERRLAKSEIWENQEVTFRTRFGKQGLWEAFLTYFGDTTPF